MYLSFFEFRAEPFGITPDPRFLFLSAAHREALAALVYGVSQRKGFISIIGEVGTGKTIILRSFLERIDRTKITAIYLLNPLASFEQIVDEILPPDFTGLSRDRFRTLQEWLISEYQEGRNVVVIVDEAQRMSSATLERLRLLSNLETANHKLIQVVLAGQPELDRRLQQPDLRQLQQRIAVRATIWPLNRKESMAYIKHRLSKVLLPGSEPVFTRFALEHLIRGAKGNPRRLNVLCDSALLAGFSFRKRPVSLRVSWAASTTRATPVRAHRRLVGRTLALALLVLVVGVSGHSLMSKRVISVSRAVSNPAGESGAAESVGERELVFLAAPVTREISGEAELTGPPAPISMIKAKSVGESHYPGDSAVPPISNYKGRLHRDSRAIEQVQPMRMGSGRVVVNRGDRLWQLCRSVYGVVDTEIVQLVMEVNPHVEDPNELAVGEEILFPKLLVAGEPQRYRAADGMLER